MHAKSAACIVLRRTNLIHFDGVGQIPYERVYVAHIAVDMDCVAMLCVCESRKKSAQSLVPMYLKVTSQHHQYLTCLNGSIRSRL
jgi:hypothetical protein